LHRRRGLRRQRADSVREVFAVWGCCGAAATAATKPMARAGPSNLRNMEGLLGNLRESDEQSESYMTHPQWAYPPELLSALGQFGLAPEPTTPPTLVRDALSRSE